MFLGAETAYGRLRSRILVLHTHRSSFEAIPPRFGSSLEGLGFDHTWLTTTHWEPFTPIECLN